MQGKNNFELMLGQNSLFEPLQSFHSLGATLKAAFDFAWRLESVKEAKSMKFRISICMWASAAELAYSYIVS